MTKRLIACGLVLALAGCDGGSTGTDAGSIDGGSTGTDAGSIDGGSTGTDAGSVDGGSTGTDAGPAGADGGPGGGAHCAESDLVLEAIAPGTSITVFNPTGAPIDTSVDYTLCQRPAYPSLASLAGGITIPPGGRHVFPWPATFSDTGTGGEVALYRRPQFGNADALADFVCWGTGRSMSRRSLAESGGRWSGPCAGAITGAALRRIPGSDGLSAASYDPTGAAAPLACP